MCYAALLLQDTVDPVAIQHASLALFLVLPLLILLALLLVLPPYWFIFKKAGFSPWLSILMLLPVINLVALWVIALSKWKVVPLAQISDLPQQNSALPDDPEQAPSQQPISVPPDDPERSPQPPC
jgi:endonuclease/exonuclease/phosphatase (EEP) superfamily protein YafD